MPPSDTFRDRLRAGQLQDAFLLAMGQAMALNVTTWVTAESEIVPASHRQPAQGHRLQTHIDLVQGDIENEIGERFITQTDYQPLRQFHLQQVAQSQRIIRQNLQSLEKLFAVLAKVQAGDPEQDEPPQLSTIGPDSAPTETFTSSPAPPPLHSEPEPWPPSTASHPTPHAVPQHSAASALDWDEVEPPWPPDPTDPFADLPLENLPLDELQIADLQSLTPGAPTPGQEPEEGSESAAEPGGDSAPPGWHFSDPPSPPSNPSSITVRSSQTRQAPLDLPPSLEDDEDWDEFVEFVEESSFEAETLESPLTNPFALPLEADSQSYPSLFPEEDSAPLSSDPPDAPNRGAPHRGTDPPDT